MSNENRDAHIPFEQRLSERERVAFERIFQMSEDALKLAMRIRETGWKRLDVPSEQKYAWDTPSQGADSHEDERTGYGEYMKMVWGWATLAKELAGLSEDAYWEYVQYREGLNIGSEESR